MTELQQLRKEKGEVKSEKLRITTNNIVAYCRVSDPRQAQEGDSVESQLEGVEDYCLDNYFIIKRKYLLEGESSKRGSERPSIIELMKYVRNPRNKISNIVVFHSSRFTRDMVFGANIIDELIELGIGFIDISSPLDIFTTSGRLEQIERFKDAEKDNNTRMTFTNAGLMRKLRKGQTMQKPPLGYTRHWIGSKRDRTQKVTINKDGEILKNAFKLKLETNLSNVDIARRITNMGLKISPKQLGLCFRNMYYCGLIKDKRLVEFEGIVEGVHPPMITINEYRIINGLIKVKKSITKKTDRPELPLRRHLLCSNCNGKITGEYKPKKKQGYYRCTNYECEERFNVNTNIIHAKYLELLDHLQINEELVPILRNQLIGFLTELNNANQRRINYFNDKIKQNQNEINRALRLGLYEPEDMARYRLLIEDIEREQAGYEEELSLCFGEIRDINRTAQDSIKIMMKIRDMWENGSLEVKLMLQSLLFPGNVFYNKKSNSLIVPSINPLLHVVGVLGNGLKIGGKNEVKKCTFLNIQEKYENRTNGLKTKNAQNPVTARDSSIDFCQLTGNSTENIPLVELPTFSSNTNDNKTLSEVKLKYDYVDIIGGIESLERFLTANNGRI